MRVRLLCPVRGTLNRPREDGPCRLGLGDMSTTGRLRSEF